ncbi:Bacteriophage A118-like holin, Hol118 [Halolactibacillus halophilus]|uniref:Holin n=1 Tax=Halolactibacillus halophilus TaxID=306540 RepID=A0A1I5MIA0_9BACI|nr:holin [Halolactibacillus halophilus]GEM02192.1 holin [Halolactibacillus halophilus]SFP08671.1 Bacteriophage A118-like holin, Hol118 [Halolactibacillus halophilus]
MEQVLVFATLLLPIVTAVVELVKKTVNISKNYLPLISLIVGLLVGAIAYPFTDFELVLRLWAGGFAGLSGTGLFELIKKRDGMTKDVA